MLNPIFFSSPRRSSATWGARWLGLCLVLPALVLATGCSGSKTPEAKDSVSGKVTLGEQPVTGLVLFVYPDAKEVSSPIKADGTYQIDNPPPGQVKVVVRSMLAGAAAPGAKPPGGGGPDTPKMPAQGNEPPAKYGNANTTPLTYEVKSGKQTFDIPLQQ